MRPWLERFRKFELRALFSSMALIYFAIFLTIILNGGEFVFYERLWIAWIELIFCGVLAVWGFIEVFLEFKE